jgi:hypothetical protein
MHALTILALLLGGAIGVWIGFVDDVELAFLAGLVAWGTATVAVFRGNFNPPDDLPSDARVDARTGVYASVIVALMVFGAVAAWIGFVDDIKIGVFIALLAWGAATFIAFSGNGGIAEPSREDSRATDSVATIGLVTVVAGALLAGAVGVWYGLVEDVEIGFAIGLLLWAGATVTTFRGKIGLS